MSYTLEEVDAAIDAICPDVAEARRSGHAWPNNQRIGVLKEAAVEYVATMHAKEYGLEHVRVLGEAMSDFKEHKKLLPRNN